MLMSQPSSVGFALIRTTRGMLRIAPSVTSRSLKKHKERKAKRKTGRGGAKQNEDGKEKGRGEKEEGAREKKEGEEMEGRKVTK